MLDTENRDKTRTRTGVNRIQKKILNGYLNSQKYRKKIYIYNTTFNLIKLSFNF